jgi:protein TonB
LRIKRSSGYAMLDRSALEAVKTWKFEPGRKMGKPANMWVEVPVKFILRDNEPM